MIESFALDRASGQGDLLANTGGAQRAWDDRQADARLLQRAAKVLERRLVKGEQLTEPRAVGQFLRIKLAGLDREVFLVMFLNSQSQIIGIETPFMGTVDSAEIHPRVVAQLSLQYNAAAVICAHNHPSQCPAPSAADRSATAQLKQALALIDVRLLDHFVVTAGGCTSLAERGWI